MTRLVSFALGQLAGGLGGLKDRTFVLVVHGMDVGEFPALGYAGLSADSLISMRVQGVTAEFIRRALASGSPNLSIEQIVNPRIQGMVE